MSIRIELTRESKRRRKSSWRDHSRIGDRLSLSSVRRCNRIDHRLSFFLSDLYPLVSRVLANLPSIDVSRTLVIFHHVPQMVPSRVMRLAHAHRVVREVDIAVVAYNEPQQSVKVLEGLSGYSETPTEECTES